MLFQLHLLLVGQHVQNLHLIRCAQVPALRAVRARHVHLGALLQVHSAIVVVLVALLARLRLATTSLVHVVLLLFKLLHDVAQELLHRLVLLLLLALLLLLRMLNALLPLGLLLQLLLVGTLLLTLQVLLLDVAKDRFQTHGLLLQLLQFLIHGRWLRVLLVLLR